MPKIGAKWVTSQTWAFSRWVRLPQDLRKITAGFKGLGQIVVSVGKGCVMNPIMAVLAALVLIVKQVANAINESEERTNKMSEAFARFKPILRTIGDVLKSWRTLSSKQLSTSGKATGRSTRIYRVKSERFSRPIC